MREVAAVDPQNRTRDVRRLVAGEEHRRRGDVARFAERQRDLSLSYAKLADTYLKAKQPTKAREALTLGRDILVVLLVQFPARSEWKQDLAWFNAQIATLKK